ncbi:low-density lipoprotein receptor-related protein 6 [Tribolium madens]|uniref:low-density lipoprotein receptor-related protein 6 n=1 Tax=Tribolium madens TaxID=41895 RepID=UPI001CF72692|nr:low-density lipoprotein receptor-related protein 6 [Tribolium madens]
MKYSKRCACILLSLLCVLQIIQGQPTNNPLLLYSTTKDIRIANTTRNSNNKITTTLLVKNFTEGPAIDYHYEEEKICWTDHGLESILCAHFNGTEVKNKVEVISTDLLSPVGLACDWFTSKLYWLDSETKRIEVATIEGLHRKVLFWTDIDQPRAIALAPMKGFMFWTDWGEVPKIERAGMNGDPTTRRVIVNTTIIWPNGLTIDYETETIYWIDGSLQFLESMTYEGTNRTTVLKSGFQYPFALTMFQTKIYWTDWKSWCIHLYDQNTKQSKELIDHLDYTVPMYIQVYNKLRQPKRPHACEKNNGGCSHLCLLSPNPPGFSCACPYGIKLIDNLTCAEGPQELLLLARRTDICLIHLDSPDYTNKILPLHDVKYTIAVDYDPVQGYIYWSDDEVKKIQRARLNGSDQSDVVTDEIQHPDGIAVDWVSRNIYWTDAGTDRVEVYRLEKKYRKVIIFNDLMEPRGIAVAPELGWLFWSDWYDKNPKVERANLDGSDRTAIVYENLGWPNGITLDLNKGRLYWCDAKTDRIEHANMDGGDRRVLISNDVPHVFGFTLMGDFLYWTDWQRRSIERAHKDTGGRREVILDQIPNVMGLKAINLGDFSGRNLCSINNGDCSQFCFYRHNKTKVCACELGYELAQDRRTCVKPKIFLLYSKKNQIGMIGIENRNNEVAIPLTGVNHASSVAYDTSTMRIYWSDLSSRTIMRSFFNGSDTEKVIDLGLTSPEGIAIDWLGLNIYWTDSFAHRIEVARLQGSSRRTLLWEGKVYDPHSIVVDPPNGFMYWSEWGTSKSIKKSAMNGGNVSQLRVTKEYAADLTLDYDSRRLYWVETKSAMILSVDLDGNDEKIIVKDNIYMPVGLTLYKDFIYWSNSAEIMKANKIDGSNPQVLHKQSHITDLQVYHNDYRGRNQCATSNGGCSDLCLALPANSPEEPTRFTCACPTHFALVNNECLPPKEFMIYSQKNLTVRLLPSPAGCLEAVLPIQGLKAIKAIDFDPVQNFLYWIEGKTHCIKRADASGNHVLVVVQGNKELQPFDLVVDPIGRLLFWTSSQNVINVTRLDNTTPFGVVVEKDNEQPRLLAIHATKRLLFYTDVGPSRQLVRARLDGSHSYAITKEADITAIAVDSENDCIVWAQGQSIYMSNIEGENQHVLVNGSQAKITQLTILSGWLYWIDRESTQLHKIELQSGKLSSPLSLLASHIVDLVSVSKPERNHSCSQVHQKKCSHLCIFNGTNPVCACPKGNVLKEDKRTCSAIQNCGPDRFTCVSVPADQDNCIPISWKCDRQKDCFDGSDELNCPECPKDQFKCKDGSCISLAHACDGIVHCADKSDEEACCRDGFQCPNTQECLPANLVCDKIDHCADGSDEHPSHCNNASKLKVSSNGVVWIILGASVATLFISGIFVYLLKRRSSDDLNDQSEDSLSPMQPKPHIKIRKGIPDVVRMSMVTGSETSYDRNHITGASSSTNESSLTCYPREPLNPPPSPATTRGSSPSSRYRPYRHYRSINQPPPPTPCSTDVCDESDCNYPTRSRYDGGPFPPPPTPRSHCHSESCPPSPSSRSSTYFNPLPPPPSPVASPPRGYDS